MIAVSGVRRSCDTLRSRLAFIFSRSASAWMRLWRLTCSVSMPTTSDTANIVTVVSG